MTGFCMKHNTGLKWVNIKTYNTTSRDKSSFKDFILTFTGDRMKKKNFCDSKKH